MKIVFFLLISLTAFSQHSLRYQKIASQLKPIDTLKIVKEYKNGKIKERSTKLRYKYKGQIFDFYNGTSTFYRRNGQISQIVEFDSFGIAITSKCLLDKGVVFSESEAYEIDTNAKNSLEFLNSCKHLKILRDVKINCLSFRAGSMYLKKEGKTWNNKRIGVWKKYSYLDKLIKEKHYKKERN